MKWQIAFVLAGLAAAAPPAFADFAFHQTAEGGGSAIDREPQADPAASAAQNTVASPPAESDATRPAASGDAELSAGGQPAAGASEALGACARATAMPGQMEPSTGQPVHLFGTVSELLGSDLILATRAGEKLTIDVTPALAGEETAVLYPGLAVEVLGSVDSDGKIRADVIQRAKGGPSAWPADCAPPGLLGR